MSIPDYQIISIRILKFKILNGAEREFPGVSPSYSWYYKDCKTESFAICIITISTMDKYHSFNSHRGSPQDGFLI